MARARTTGPAAYKLSAVKMIADPKRAVAEVARRLDVGAAPLRARRGLSRTRQPDAGGRRTATPPGREHAPLGRAGAVTTSRRVPRRPAECEIASGDMFATRDPARAGIVEYREVCDSRVRGHSSPVWELSKTQLATNE